MELRLQVFQRLQGLLLQAVVNHLWNSSGHLLGMRVRHHHVHARVGRDALPALLHDQLRVYAEVLGYLHPVLLSTILRGVQLLLL